MLADKRHSTKAIRTELRQRDIRNGRTGGHPPALDAEVGKRRDVVDRRVDWLQQFRSIATRFDKTSTSQRGMVDPATLLLRL